MEGHVHYVLAAKNFDSYDIGALMQTSQQGMRLIFLIFFWMWVHCWAMCAHDECQNQQIEGGNS